MFIDTYLCVDDDEVSPSFVIRHVVDRSGFIIVRLSALRCILALVVAGGPCCCRSSSGWLVAAGWWLQLSLVALVVDAFSSGWLVALVVAGGFDLVVAGAVALVIVTLLVLGGWL